MIDWLNDRSNGRSTYAYAPHTYIRFYAQEHEHGAEADGRDEGEHEEGQRQPDTRKGTRQRQQARAEEPFVVVLCIEYVEVGGEGSRPVTDESDGGGME
jgi:hypothetical protein